MSNYNVNQFHRDVHDIRHLILVAVFVKVLALGLLMYALR